MAVSSLRRVPYPPASITTFIFPPLSGFPVDFPADRRIRRRSDAGNHASEMTPSPRGQTVIVPATVAGALIERRPPRSPVINLWSGKIRFVLEFDKD
jgi:hypothetical protein